MDFLSQLVYPISLACVIPRVESTFFINIKKTFRYCLYFYNKKIKLCEIDQI